MKHIDILASLLITVYLFGFGHYLAAQPIQKTEAALIGGVK